MPGHIAYVASFWISDCTTNYQMSKNGAYPSKRIRLYKIFHKEKVLVNEEVKPVAKFANLYKKQPTRVVTSLVSLTHLKRSCQQKNIILMDAIAIQYRNML